MLLAAIASRFVSPLDWRSLFDLTWAVYGSYLALRFFAGLRGRRAAYVLLAGFVLVAIVRLALPVTHFS